MDIYNAIFFFKRSTILVFLLLIVDFVFSQQKYEYIEVFLNHDKFHVNFGDTTLISVSYMDRLQIKSKVEHIQNGASLKNYMSKMGWEYYDVITFIMESDAREHGNNKGSLEGGNELKFENTTYNSRIEETYQHMTLYTFRKIKW